VAFSSASIRSQIPTRLFINSPGTVRGGKTPDLDLSEAEAMGYKLAIARK
jgi:hypothetical protein